MAAIELTVIVNKLAIMTTTHGHPIAVNRNSHAAGSRGPLRMADHQRRRAQP